MIEYTIKLSKKDDELLRNLLKMEKWYDADNMEQNIKKYLLTGAHSNNLIDNLVKNIPNDSIIIDNITIQGK